MDINPKFRLPNETVVLVLGILSIPMCCCYNAGLILGIVALVLASKDMRLYQSAPDKYEPKSLSNLNGGRVCAIIGVVLNALSVCSTIWWIANFGWMSLFDAGELQRILEELQAQ